MALEELRAVEAYQWCPSGNPLEVRPGVASVFIAGAEGTPQGYGYGEGWSIVFGSSQGEISLEPESWIVRLSNGVISVEQEAPGEAEVLSHEQVLERYRR